MLSLSARDILRVYSYYFYFWPNQATNFLFILPDIWSKYDLYPANFAKYLQINENHPWEQLTSGDTGYVSMFCGLMCQIWISIWNFIIFEIQTLLLISCHICFHLKPAIMIFSLQHLCFCSRYRKPVQKFAPNLVRYRNEAPLLLFPEFGTSLFLNKLVWNIKF